MGACRKLLDATTAGFLHEPDHGNGYSVVLTHGAGSNCQAPLLIAVAEALQIAGYRVLRYDLPFRQARKTGPPHPSQGSQDRAGLRTAVDALRALNNEPVLLAGHSYGGRQASILAAEEPRLLKALLLLSYPLHPPGKPQQLRTAHFAQLRTASLFIHGDADPFGSMGEMQQAISEIPALHALRTIDRAGHDLKRGRFDIATQVIQPLVKIVDAP